MSFRKSKNDLSDAATVVKGIWKSDYRSTVNRHWGRYAAKAIAAEKGHAVMLGSMLYGTDESPGEQPLP